MNLHTQVQVCVERPQKAKFANDIASREHSGCWLVARVRFIHTLIASGAAVHSAHSAIRGAGCTRAKFSLELAVEGLKPAFEVKFLLFPTVNRSEALKSKWRGLSASLQCKGSWESEI